MAKVNLKGVESPKRSAFLSTSVTVGSSDLAFQCFLRHREPSSVGGGGGRCCGRLGFYSLPLYMYPDGDWSVDAVFSHVLPDLMTW